MPIYDKSGSLLSNVYGISGNSLLSAYDIDGNDVFNSVDVDYTKYSFTQKWASKGISNTQGFDIYDEKVFWVSKSGNSSIPANCYVWNLSDGSQALSSAYITIYSGHGNNLCFVFPTLYATSAYTPNAYVNTMTNEFVTSLSKTLAFDDGCVDCDACVDENDDTILWTLGHTGYNAGDPFLISKWDLSELTDNGGDTYTPKKLKTISISSPSNRYFQGLKHHDNLLWYGNGNGGVPSYIRGVDPNTGTEEYVIDLSTTTEVEGLAWVGNTLYVGFAGMMLREYTFAPL